MEVACEAIPGSMIVGARRADLSFAEASRQESDVIVRNANCTLTPAVIAFSLARLKKLL